jgi:hypothetical protein
MTDFEIPLAEPFTATERGRYEPAWRDGAWTVEPSPHEWGGIELRPGDTVTALRIEEPPFVVRRNPDQEPDGALLLDLPMHGNDAGAATIRDYLVALLGVAMDIKSPFGSSDWRYDLYEALANGGFVPAERDEDGYIEWGRFDKSAAAELIETAIGALGG